MAKSRRTRWAAVSCVLAALTAGACEEDGEGEACNRDLGSLDCDEGLVCVSGSSVRAGRDVCCPRPPEEPSVSACRSLTTGGRPSPGVDASFGAGGGVNPTAGAGGTDAGGGASGTAGASGASGSSGASGASGSSGASGASGSSGASGASGTAGASGASGTAGASGASGSSGAPSDAGSGDAPADAPGD